MEDATFRQFLDKFIELRELTRLQTLTLVYFHMDNLIIPFSAVDKEAFSHAKSLKEVHIFKSMVSSPLPEFIGKHEHNIANQILALNNVS